LGKGKVECGMKKAEGIAHSVKADGRRKGHLNGEFGMRKGVTGARKLEVGRKKATVNCYSLLVNY
jgi:hypothetical protein